ncbi:hypothetical protein BDQ12DRAFT_85400 [Crucibulum laeve]|uniref:F-box domain-containing protein n=1 Tax=Crucibulum laeve TaxID=68775 RepID=A0A5C3M0J1_9AGAR|nr:hypothetical protein BDQ12DRAFT_85400 [Crucibulum laeve]
MDTCVITNYPHDLLLEIVAYLSLEDLLSFLSVCSYFEKLSECHILWIRVLEEVQRCRPLACPIGFDLTQADVQELIEIARKTYHLERNWNCTDSPQLMRSVQSKEYTSLKFEDPGSIISVISGSSIVILYLEGSESLVCCDMQGSRPSSSIRVGNIKQHAHYDLLGDHLIALIIGQPFAEEISLFVISITYGKNQKTEMKTVYTSPLYHECRALFILEDIVALLPFSDDDNGELIAHVTNFKSGINTEIPLMANHPIENTAFVFCSTLTNTPHIVVCDNVDYVVYKIPMDAFKKRLDNDPPSNTSSLYVIQLIEVINVHADEDNSVFDSELADVKWSSMGLRVMEVQYRREFSLSTSTRISLWPPSTSPTPLSPIQTTLPGTITTHNFEEGSPWLLASSSSGIYSVMLLDRKNDLSYQEDTKLTLNLIHYSKNPPEICSSQIELPFFINPCDIYSVGIDERCGVIYLSHFQGYVFALTYA